MLLLKGAQDKSPSSSRLLGFRNNVLRSTPEHSSWLGWMCPLRAPEANWAAVIKEQKGFGGDQRLVWEGTGSAVLALLPCPCGPQQDQFTLFYIAAKEERATPVPLLLLPSTDCWQKTGKKTHFQIGKWGKKCCS